MSLIFVNGSLFQRVENLYTFFGSILLQERWMRRRIADTGDGTDEEEIE
jgi:hypothetical protein